MTRILATNAPDIALQLANLRDLQECVLDKIRWGRHALSVTMRFRYIWTADGMVCYSAGLEPRPVYLVFRLVQDFRFCAGLTATQCEHIDNINWGIDEVSCVRLVSGSKEIEQYEHLPTPMHHVEIRWENDRRIDVVFSQLLIKTASE